MLFLDPGQDLAQALVLDDGGMTDALQLERVQAKLRLKGDLFSVIGNRPVEGDGSMLRPGADPTLAFAKLEQTSAADGVGMDRVLSRISWQEIGDAEGDYLSEIMKC